MGISLDITESGCLLLTFRVDVQHSQASHGLAQTVEGPTRGCSDIHPAR